MCTYITCYYDRRPWVLRLALLIFAKAGAQLPSTSQPSLCSGNRSQVAATAACLLGFMRFMPLAIFLDGASDFNNKGLAAGKELQRAREEHIPAASCFIVGASHGLSADGQCLKDTSLGRCTSYSQRRTRCVVRCRDQSKVGGRSPRPRTGCNLRHWKCAAAGWTKSARKRGRRRVARETLAA